jgi:hypothetical protein
MGKLANLNLGIRTVTVAAILAAAATATGFGMAAASSSSGAGSSSAGSPGAPAQPVIGSGGLPASPTNATTATFTYTDARPAVSFLCSLDAAAFSSCPSSGITYRNLGNATHTFRVEARNGNGPVSSPASFSWTVANQSFPISGSLTTPLAPGIPPQTLNLVVTNPYTFTMKVTAITVSLSSTSKANCAASTNYKVTQYTGSGFTVNAGVTETLTQAGVPSSQLPTLQMLDLSTNQDVCQGATVNLAYSGTATTP